MLFKDKKVYIGAKFQDKTRAQDLAMRIMALGGEVVSSWLGRDTPQTENHIQRNMRLKDEVRKDLLEIYRCDIFILLHWDPAENAEDWKYSGTYDRRSIAGQFSGGRFVELGHAISCGKFIIIEKHGSSVFDYLADIVGIQWIYDVSLSSHSSVSTVLSSQSSRVLCLEEESRIFGSSNGGSGCGVKSSEPAIGSEELKRP